MTIWNCTRDETILNIIFKITHNFKLGNILKLVFSLVSELGSWDFSNKLKALLIGTIMRFEDNLKYDLLHHPEKKYEHKLNLHPFIALLEKAKNESGKFD